MKKYFLVIRKLLSDYLDVQLQSNQRVPIKEKKNAHDKKMLQHHMKLYSPKNVPKKKGNSGTFIIGDVMLMNQLGRNGVIRRNMM
jgi:hypothetical protein